MGSNSELSRVIPHFPVEALDHEVNLQGKNGDPRKAKYTVHLFWQARQFWNPTREGRSPRLVVDLLADQNLFAHQVIEQAEVANEITKGKTVKPRNRRYEARQHMVTEHTMTVMAGVVALGQIAQEAELLGSQDILDLLVAAELHDFNKPREAQLVSESLNDPNKGYGQEGYDQAGKESKALLEKLRVPEKIIELTQSVGHTSCPEIDKKLVFSPITPELLKKLILHYVDDIVINPNIIDPTVDKDGSNALDRRCSQNENNPRYANYNNAWINDPRRLINNETAFEMQRRVGHKVEEFLSFTLGVNNPSRLPQIINNRIQKNMQEVWDQKPLDLKHLRLQI